MCSKPKAYRSARSRGAWAFRNTVARYLSAEVPRYKPREPRPTKLGAFEAYILDRMAAAAPEIIAAPALLRELRARGYDGQLRSLQAFMNAHKSVPKPDPVVRFETGPVGRCSAISLSSVEAPTRFTPSPPRSASVVGAGHASPPMNAPRRWSPVIMRCSKPWAAFLARSFTTTPRPSLSSAMRMATVNTDGTPGCSTPSGTASCPGCANRTVRRPRARSSDSTAICAAISMPLASQLKQSGLMLDAVTANVEVSKWLRDVANQRVHPVTGLAPAILLEQRERACLRDMPGYAVPRLPARAVARPRVDPAMSIQHPLSVYQQLLTEVRA